MLAFILLPSTRVTRSEGMVIAVTIVGSSPRPAGGEPGWLSTMTTPIAPAFWQFSVLVLKVQVPRLTTQILPAIAAALVSAQQPSFGSAPQVPEGVVGSTAITPFAV